LIIETVNPGAEVVRESVEDYVRRYPDYADALRMYGAIMEEQQSALESISCNLEPLDAEEQEARLRGGETLFDPRDLEVDGALFRELVAKICAAVDTHRPGGFTYCERLASWDGLSDGNLDDTREKLLTGAELGFTPDGDLSEAERELVKNILWEALAPFYRVCASMLSSKMEQSSWLKGFCPVCGGAPLMGKYRQDDGLWLVECSLCHTLWNIQRASCPFCDESEGSLEFLYIGDEGGLRANYCKACRRYVKTIDLRDSEKDVLMPLEDIVTIQLDLAARKD
jgi:FdhE protein